MLKLQFDWYITGKSFPASRDSLFSYMLKSKGCCLQDRKLHLAPLYRAMLTFGVNGPRETSNTLICLMPQRLGDTGHTNLIGLCLTFSCILVMIQ